MHCEFMHCAQGHDTYRLQHVTNKYMASRTS